MVDSTVFLLDYDSLPSFRSNTIQHFSLIFQICLDNMLML